MNINEFGDNEFTLPIKEKHLEKKELRNCMTNVI
jgi:hypothetical protein